MLVKVSSFHVYTHQNEADNSKIENCSVCELVSLSQENQFLVAAEIEAPTLNLIFIPYLRNFQAPFIDAVKGTVSIYHSRPPPALV